VWTKNNNAIRDGDGGVLMINDDIRELRRFRKIMITSGKLRITITETRNKKRIIRLGVPHAITELKKMYTQY